jgi:hypothetical protein
LNSFVKRRNDYLIETVKLRVIITLILNVFSIAVYSQHSVDFELPSNSFENEYCISNPSLIYSFDEISKIHNYSHNWDFDNDGIKDELYFVGTGGAHIYYFLRVVLSSDKKVRDVNFIQSDFPFLNGTDFLNSEKTNAGFAVLSIEKELTPSIIVQLDESTFDAFKKELLKEKIKTRNSLISFKNGKTKFGYF